MTTMAAFIPDREDAGVSWLLVGELDGGERHAQLRGPREATVAELDELLTCIGWARTQDWVPCGAGLLASLNVYVVNEELATAYRKRI